MITKATGYRIYPVVILVFLVFLSLSYIRFALSQSSRQFGAEFEKQNYLELSSGDIFSLTTRLNSLSTSVPWVCITASQNSKVFFSQQRGDCSKGLVREVILVSSSSNAAISIKFVLTLSREFKESALMFLILQILTSTFLIYASRQVQIEKNRAAINISHIAKQLSHDIRSPLAALEMISSDLNELGEEKRLIIRNAIARIRDIANSLVKTEKKLTESSNHEVVRKFENTLLTSLVDIIVTEKRLQYRDAVGVHIEFLQTYDSYGLFSEIFPNEFKRALSNILSNGVEALTNGVGTVAVSLSSSEKNIFIKVSDNGKGIPLEQIPKLGQRGVSLGKKEGTGLGLSHAIETVKGFLGHIEIKSVQDVGTEVVITLPRKSPPKWFVPKVRISQNMIVIVFDDDQAIHDIWDQRFRLMCSEYNLKLVHFSSGRDLRRYYSTEFDLLENALFLMDYEILGTSETGLSLIQDLGIQAQSILVTSRYEDRKVRELCELLNVKLIPKSMSGFVPIEIESV
jgi:signal transduction histidine kinase